MQPVHSKGDQTWVFIGRADAKVETPVLWPPHVKSWLTGKDPDAGRDWGQEEKGMTEDEMAGWHHRLNGHEFGWIPGVGDGQGGLWCCDSWGRKELDTTEWLNWTENIHDSLFSRHWALWESPEQKIILVSFQVYRNIVVVTRPSWTATILNDSYTKKPAMTSCSCLHSV